MPLVEVSMLAGRSDEVKERLIAEVTRAVVRVADVAPDAVTVIIRDVPKTDWGRAGEPYSRKRS